MSGTQQLLTLQNGQPYQPTWEEVAALQQHRQIIDDLYYHPSENPNGFNPHFGQRLILEDAFILGKERILGVNSRNWGKTEEAIHIHGRVCLTRETIHPKYPKDQIIACYYVAPTKELASEILFSTQRIHRCVPERYIYAIKEHNKELWFTRDGVNPCGVLHIVGTKDIYGLIGVKHAGPIIVDEAAWTKEDWHKAKEQDYKHWKPLVIYFTTWPKEREHYIDKMVLEYKANPKYSFHQRPQFDNVILEEHNPGFFEEQLADYQRRGEMLEYRRDVLSERVVGGDDLIFERFNRETYYQAQLEGDWDKTTMSPKNPLAYENRMDTVPMEEHVWPERALWKYCENLVDECTKIVHFDPGHTQVFAVNFDMHNPYSKEFFRLREIYKQKSGDLTTRSLMEEVVNIIVDTWGYIDAHKIKMGYDEAEKWFANEFYGLIPRIWHRTPEQWAPEDHDFHMKCRKLWGERPWTIQQTMKASQNTDDQISLVREMLGSSKLIYSDRCPYSIWEIANYRLDSRGKFPDKWNHTIDNLRYEVALINYTIEEKERPKPVHPMVSRFDLSTPESKSRGAFSDLEIQNWEE